MGNINKLFAGIACAIAGTTAWAASIGDGPVVREHLEQQAIEAGEVDFDTLFEHGRLLFAAKFNTYDGQSRPGTTGGGAPREVGSAPRFIRTSAPDANSCAGCHNDPFPGGAGDIVANVFVLAQTLDPVTESVSGDLSNERNTLGMQGSGAIEMLAREMTAELHAQRAQIIAEATAGNRAVTHTLRAKGVEFGALTANADGSVDSSQVKGVNADLVIRPFHQKGAVISLREFSNNAMNHHHGMQPTERFGHSATGSTDFDQDGVHDELSVGDITAVSVYQAALAVPGQVLDDDPEVLRAVIRGEQTFERIGCADCHVPALELEDRHFSEPNPYNPAGNLQVSQVSASYSFDLTQHGELPRLERNEAGGAIVRAFTDLKRHNLCDAQINHFCNEQVVQGGIDTAQFLTRKLWDVGNSAPYGHKGDLTTLTEAILAHGGEARASRDRFESMSARRRDELIEFLKSLQMLPPGTPSLSVDKQMRPVDKRALIAAIRQKDSD